MGVVCLRPARAGHRGGDCGGYLGAHRKGRRRPESQWRLDRYFSEVWLEDTGCRPGAPRLFVRCGGQRVELGSFLLEDDRRNLARQLRRCIGPVASAGIRPAA
ncbi:MAG: DUF2244 domain-containing protein [Arhodomonas sp.]|nr:DUF2244 domain-containing protein [Arhodomonas sp.]